VNFHWITATLTECTCIVTKGWIRRVQIAKVTNQHLLQFKTCVCSLTEVWKTMFLDTATKQSLSCRKNISWHKNFTFRKRTKSCGNNKYCFVTQENIGIRKLVCECPNSERDRVGIKVFLTESSVRTKQPCESFSQQRNRETENVKLKLYFPDVWYP